MQQTFVIPMTYVPETGTRFWYQKTGTRIQWYPRIYTWVDIVNLQVVCTIGCLNIGEYNVKLPGTFGPYENNNNMKFKYQPRIPILCFQIEFFIHLFIQLGLARIESWKPKNRDLNIIWILFCSSLGVFVLYVFPKNTELGVWLGVISWKTSFRININEE